MLRLGKPVEALDTLESVAAVSCAEHGERALLRAVAFSRTSRFELASAALVDAHVYSISCVDPAMEAEVEYYKALAALGDESLDEARAACLHGLEIVATPRAFARTDGIVPVAHVRSRVQELLGVIDAAQGHYGELLGHARSALATLDDCPTPDRYQEAYALRNLSILARDFDIADDAGRMAARVPTFAWTDDVRRVEFTTVEALGWCSALRGDNVAALRLFRRAADVSTTDPQRVIVGVDRAMLARESGYSSMVVEEVEHALRLADRCNWERAEGDSRDALLALAQAAASLAPEHARETLDRYTSIRNEMDSTYAARVEPRIRAEEAYTHGLVLRAEGRIAASTDRLRTAFALWETIGFDWRAGRAALELAEMDAGEMFRLAVRRELTTRPAAFFSERARRVA